MTMSRLKSVSFVKFCKMDRAARQNDRVWAVLSRVLFAQVSIHIVILCTAPGIFNASWRCLKKS